MPLRKSYKYPERPINLISFDSNQIILQSPYDTKYNITNAFKIAKSTFDKIKTPFHSPHPRHIVITNNNLSFIQRTISHSKAKSITEKPCLAPTMNINETRKRNSAIDSPSGEVNGFNPGTNKIKSRYRSLVQSRISIKTKEFANPILINSTNRKILRLFKKKLCGKRLIMRNHDDLHLSKSNEIANVRRFENKLKQERKMQTNTVSIRHSTQLDILNLTIKYISMF